MAVKTIIKPPDSPAAVGPYNHAVRIGDLLFCAGQIPISPVDGNLIIEDIEAQDSTRAGKCESNFGQPKTYICKRGEKHRVSH